MGIIKKYKFITAVILSLLLGAVCAVSTSFDVLSKKSDVSSYINDSGVKTVLLKEPGHVSVIFSDDGDTPGRFINKLEAVLYPREEKPLRLRIIVSTDDGGGINETVLSDVNPLYVGREVIDISRDNVVSVDIISEDQAFSVGDVRIDNSFSFNVYLFITGTLLSLAILLTACFYTEEDPVKFVRKSFLTLSMCLGTALITALPAGKTGYDEETHIQAVLQLSSFPLNELHISNGLLNQVTVTEYNNPEALPKGEAERAEYEKRLSGDADYKSGSVNPYFYVMPNRVPSYLPMAAALKAGKFLNLPWTVLLRLARFANLLFYTALIYAALWVLPDGHVLMAAMALFPGNLFTASTVSYDPAVTGFLFLGTAFFLRLLLSEYEKRQAFIRDSVLMAACFLIGCLPKAVYAPLMLTALLIPLRKQGDRRKKRIYAAFVIGAFLLTVLLFIAPTVLSPSETGDTRGGGDVSEQSQIGFILGNPLRYAVILLRQMISWIPQTMLGPDCTTFMGHIVNGSTVWKGYWIPCLIIMLVPAVPGLIEWVRNAVNKKKTADGELKVYERLWILFMCFGASVLIWTAMYVAFTPPGSETIGGVQGRYFAPLLFAVYFALGYKIPAFPKKVRLVVNGRMCYYILMTVCGAVTALQILRAAVLPLCI